MSSTGTTGSGLSPKQMQETIGSLSSPDTVESPFGPLDFFDGVPTTRHSVHGVRRARPDARHRGVPQRRAGRVAGGDASWPAVSGRHLATGHRLSPSPRANSGSLFLTPNTETTYGTTFLDLKAWGPTVIEAPPQSLCVVDDFWFRYVADMGIAGPDRGQGGKYLFVPPGYEGDLPDGYFTYRCPTLHQLGGAPRPGRRPGHEADPDLPARRRPTRPRTTSSSTSPRRSSTPCTATTSHSSRRSTSSSRRSRPTHSTPSVPGSSRPSGSSTGGPFAPDDRMRAHPRPAPPKSAPALARSDRLRPQGPRRASLYGSWKNAFVGGSYEFLRDGARLLDARTQFHYLATVVTPAMAHAQVGAGSAYAYTIHDSNGDLLDGAQDLPSPRRPEPAGEELLGSRCLRHPDPVPAPGALDDLAGIGQQLRHAPGQRRRLLRPLLRSHRTRRAGSRTGSKPSPASPGSSSSGSTARSSHGSTRPGSSTSSSPSTESPLGAHPQTERPNEAISAHGQRPELTLRRYSDARSRVFDSRCLSLRRS